MGGEELARIVQTQQEKFSDQLTGEMAAHKPMFGSEASQPDRTLSCPACSHPMNVINYAGDSGVFVDRCDVCSGLWLDHAGAGEGSVRHGEVGG